GARGKGPVREGECRVLALGVVGGPDLPEGTVPQLVVAAALAVDDVEATVGQNAGALELDLVGMHESEPLDGRERDPGDRRHVDSLRGRPTRECRPRRRAGPG